MRKLKIVALTLVALIVNSSAETPSEIRFNDGTGMRDYVVACDELYCRPEQGTPHVVAEADQKTAQAITAKAAARERGSKAKFDLVLYAKGKERSLKNRRTLSRRIHVEMGDGGKPKVIAKAAGASSFEVPDFAPKSLLLTFPHVGDSLTKLAVVRKLPGVKSARPLIGKRRSRKLVPNDSRYAWSTENTSYQWHLKNTGQNGSVVGLDVNIESVWDNYLGTGVTISVVDDGLEVAHPDLASNVNTLIDHDWNDSTPDDPTPPLEEQDDGSYWDHGTSVAGVSAGRGNNGIGVSGAAPRAQLVGLKILTADTTPADDAAALGWRTDVIDISNNSWGEPDDGEALFTPDSLVVSALEAGVANGRGGKGTVYVWSAGNGRDSGDYANYDGYVNRPETIGVGSINFQGRQSYYSESGANVLIAAPSDADDGDPGITTTTLTTNQSYTDTFGGTSSAAPLVSGVIALLLESNPALGWRDVQEILVRSARKVDETSTGWSTNGAGFHFHHGYGAGMIDAAAAVALAETWKNLGARESREVALDGIDATVPDNSSTGVSRSLELGGDDLRAEHVLCTIDIDHAYRGDLVITLTSPSGTVSQFSEVHGDGNEDYENYTFLSVRHWGEMARGTWTVKVRDGETGDEGMLRGVSLSVYGAALPTGYEAWVKTSFLASEQNQPNIVASQADPDNDGRKNLLEYALGADPRIPDSNHPNDLWSVAGTSMPTVRFVADTSKADLTYKLMHSMDLTKWNMLTPTVLATNGNLETRQGIVMLGDDRRSFFQLEVSRDD